MIKCLYLLLMSTNQVLKVWAYKCPIEWLNVYIYYLRLHIQMHTSYWIVSACKRSLKRLCFYTCLSVILFTGGVSASVHVGIHPLGRHPWTDTPRKQTSPTQCMLGDTGNKQVVPILLECILVTDMYTHTHIHMHTSNRTVTDVYTHIYTHTHTCILVTG